MVFLLKVCLSIENRRKLLTRFCNVCIRTANFRTLIHPNEYSYILETPKKCSIFMTAHKNRTNNKIKNKKDEEQNKK
jgi:hypothetical protein